VGDCREHVSVHKTERVKRTGWLLGDMRKTLKAAKQQKVAHDYRVTGGSAVSRKKGAEGFYLTIKRIWGSQLSKNRGRIPGAEIG